MSSCAFKSTSNASNNILVEQILEQGQRLRNSMVCAILNNDPFNKEIISNKSLQYTQFKTTTEQPIDELPSTSTFLDSRREDSSRKKATVSDSNKLFAFLQGDLLSQEDDRIALDTLRTISPTEFLFRSRACKRQCDCDICREDDNNRVRFCKSDIPTLPLYKLNEPNIDVISSRSKSRISYTENFKYVNSIKVIVYSLKFNTAGRRKLLHCCDNKKYNSSVSKTVFVEYKVPDSLTKCFTEVKSKVNTGLHCNKAVRFCSKKFHDDEAIYFKHVSIHDVVNIYNYDLNDISLVFCISSRTMNEKKALTIGEASFNLGTLTHNSLLMSNQELTVRDTNSGITLGSLKVSLMLGCDKIHFGHDFIESINLNKENTTLSSNDSITKLSDIAPTSVAVPFVSDERVAPAKTTLLVSKAKRRIKPILNEVPKQIQRAEESLLYGLVYIGEANYLRNPMDSYVVCHSFQNNDTVVSRMYQSNSNPVFAFYQLEPILYDDAFLHGMRENYIVVEFWQKCNVQDQLIGISKLSLHQFYITYRNPAIVKHLLKNKYPVISVDWWEPIVSPTSGEVCGQTQALLAVGTEAQIQVLELSRGIKESQVTAKSSPIISEAEILKYSKKSLPITRHKVVHAIGKTKTYNGSTSTAENEEKTQTSIATSPFRVEKIKKSIQKVDKGIQSNMETNRTDNNVDEKKDLLVSLIEQLGVHKNVSVENSTNTDVQRMDVTETQAPNERVRISEQAEDSSTTNNRRETFTVPADVKRSDKSSNDIIKAFVEATLSGDATHPFGKQTRKKDTTAEPSFKVHINVEEALHLPSRKKCKSKRSKGKHIKNDDSIYPSAYVTFETVPGAELKITRVIPKSSGPKWDYRADVTLPTDLLFDNQKRLLFKVWRKSNGPHLIPNRQTDIVLGFAALDLTVLMSGLPSIQGWFNIVDFSNKCNGQIKINVTPLENVQKLNKHRTNSTGSCNDDTINCLTSPSTSAEETAQKDEPSELLSRALKRKFTELDEITQRLRLRLSKVTNDDSDVSNDDFSDAFERDINTLCVEDDFDTNNFEEDFIPIENIPASEGLLQQQQQQPSCSYAQDNRQNQLQLLIPTNGSIPDSNLASLLMMQFAAADGKLLDSSDGQTSFNNHLTQGKLRIDTLLEKLSLITGNERSVVENSFSNRYVPGCSIDAVQRTDSNSKTFVDGILKELGIDGDGENGFNSSLLQEFYSSASTNSTADVSSIRDLLSNSDDSLLSDNISRSAPDGEGSGSNGNVKTP